MNNICEIKIKNIIFLIDEEDFELVSRYKWHLRPSSDSFYAYNNYTKGIGTTRLVMMHRLITNCPIGMDVDHINGNTLDNRKCNLRICTRQENLCNRKPAFNFSNRYSSKYKGITLVKRAKNNKWHAQIEYHYKHMSIGYFVDEVEAAKAYDKKAKELFGEYAYLNFP